MNVHGGKTRGFTLIELAVVVAILAIIALVAMPSYAASINKSRRTEGKILLQTVLAAEERYYINFNRYSNDAGSSGLGIALDSQPGSYYTLAKLEVSVDGQSLTATVDPQNAQQSDACGSLTLDSIGRRGAAGGAVSDCW